MATEPTTIETADLVRMVEGQHHYPEDLGEGDLSDRLWQFTAYEQRTMDIDDFDLDEFFVHDDLVEEYAQRMHAGEVPPPIIWDPINGSTIDGISRLNAYARCGIRQVTVYVGVEKTYVPIPSM